MLLPGGLHRKRALCPIRQDGLANRPGHDSDVAALALKATAEACRPAHPLVAASRFDTSWELMPIAAF